ncbi:MAG: DNA topoisomerase I [Coriobacteriia bacterium]|nr:DNA topoisomerase I [Coriobacteriia bacterium]
MKLIITEKNIAARRIADILAQGKPKADKVYTTPIYRFTWQDDDCICVGLAGHILKVDFPLELNYTAKTKAWEAVTSEGEIIATDLPASLPTPPWNTKRKPFSATGLGLETWKIESLPYLTWAPVLKLPDKRDLIRSLKNLAKKADEIVIATDFDREGELIGSDASSVVREVNATAPIFRARYSALTKGEVTRAFGELTTVDDDLAQAGEARQDIDLIWGAVLTRYLTKVRFAGLGKPRSAGRVQTPTLKLIVDKEAERDAFEPEDYWVVAAELQTREGETFTTRHVKDHFTDGGAAQAAVSAVRAAIAAGTPPARVVELEQKERVVKPPVPFNTTTLMAVAAGEGLSPTRTMRLAESLYMSGLISYPRVDNTVYPASLDLAESLRRLAQVPELAEHANALLAQGALKPTRGKMETTDHPPIHPTDTAVRSKLRDDEWKLYNLIARRFMATLSVPAVYHDLKANFDVAGEAFFAKGQTLIKPGFRAFYPYGAKKEDYLPALAQGDELKILSCESDQRQTKPPARYSEGGIITTMEKLGLGTKATRADAVQRLVDRAYIQIENKALKPTQLGRAVVDALSRFAAHITSPDMTAQLEGEMDAIASGTRKRREVVAHSRELLSDSMATLLEKTEEVSEMLKDASHADSVIGTCPKCGKDIVVRSNMKTKGQFAGCSGWNAEGTGCDVSYPLPEGKIEPLEEPCSVCGAPRVRIIQFRRKPVERCLNPECRTNYEAPIDLGACPVCAAAGKEGRIIGQRNPRSLKRFARCTNYEECQTSYPLPGNGEIKATGEYCKACGSPEIVVTTRRGPWRICINMDCPAKKEAEAKKAEKAAAAAAASEDAGTKKPAPKKAAAKKKAPAKKKAAVK